MARSLSMCEATDLVRSKMGCSVPVNTVPEPRKADLAIYAADTRKAQRLLGWTPRIGLDEGFDQIIAWVRENEDALRGLYCGAPQSVAAAI